VTIQMGHVPRTKGRTGTHREQEFAREVAPRVQARLEAAGVEVRVIGADDAVPGGDVFVALHTDGSTNADRRGASVGYPDGNGEVLAAAWKRRHQAHGYPAGFHGDNYTDALRGYYGFGKARGHRLRFLAEHGTTTNADDEAWLFGHLDECATAHAEAILEVLGLGDGGGGTVTGGGDVGAATGHPVLREKAKGDAVRHLQTLIGVAVDGSFGPKTRAAVVAVQAAAGIEQDGVVGPASWSHAHPVIGVGDSGDAVGELQAKLGVSEAGFGEATRGALVAFQQGRGLQADGICGPKTFRALFF
jgi:peptidoglycan hydrolase-like protein with peptidoglycan-binding domain